MMENSIGIISGVGPYAGLALQHAILRHTHARRDQDYPPVISISAPHAISDRTEYILGKTSVNPAYGIIAQIRSIYSCGARYVGIPCNSAHADAIFSVIQSGITDLQDLILVNMIDETFMAMKEKKPPPGRVGLLATIGTYKSGLFADYGARHNVDMDIPHDESLQDAVHRSIYDETFGIKVSGRLHEKGKANLDMVFNYYRENNIDTVILGCTELSAVFKSESYGMFTLIDPVNALARELVALQKKKKTNGK